MSVEKTNPAGFWDHKWDVLSGLPQDQPRLATILELWPDDVERFLDVGAGDGRITNLVEGRARFAVAQDISVVGLGKVSALAVQGTSDGLPYRDGSFDLVLCSEVIEHLPGELLERTAAEVARVSRRYLLVTTPFEERLENGLIQCDRCMSWFHASLHCQSFSRARMEALFGAAGLRIAAYATSGVQPFHSVRLGKVTRALTGYYGGFWHPQLSCPVCGSRSIEQRRARGHPLRVLFGGLNVLLGRVLPSRPHNHVVLFEKRHEPEPSERSRQPEART